MKRWRVGYNKKAEIIEIVHTRSVYNIELSRLATKENLICWVHHLAEKTWVTAPMLREFIDTVYEAMGWGNPEDEE